MYVYMGGVRKAGQTPPGKNEDFPPMVDHANFASTCTEPQQYSF